MAEKPDTSVATDASAGTAAPAAGGGLKAWLPLIVTVLLMPAMAWAMTQFVLLPKVKAALSETSETPAADSGEKTEAAAHNAGGGGGHGGKSGGKGGAFELTPQLKERGVKVAANGRITIPLNKILVNVAGTMGSRYLLTSVTLSGSKPNFVDLVLGNEAQLLDTAAGVLGSKTLADLEKPNSRQVVRTELLTVFNNVLGSGTVEEIFFTEFAIQ